MTFRRFAAPLALSVVTATALAACSTPKPVASPTGTTVTSPAASTTTQAPPTQTAEPTVTVIEDPAGDMSRLKTAATDYAAYVGTRNFAAAAGLVCQGLRDKGDNPWVNSQLTSPHVYLEFAEVNPEGYADSFAQAEFPDAGVKTYGEAAVLFDVTPGSEYPNPTMLTRWVLASDGWQFCGAAPDA